MDRRVNDNYIYEVIKHGSLSRAAKALGISQPALSSGLTVLETQLGFKIFNRKRVPIVLTPEGEIYLDYLSKLQTLSEDLEKRISNYRLDEGCKLSIGAPVAYAKAALTDAIIMLQAENPEFKVKIKSAPLASLVEMANKGEINCFISTSAELPKKFEKKLLDREKLYLCVPKSNPVNKKLADFAVDPGNVGKPFDYSVFSDEEFVFLEEGQPLREKMEEFFYQNEISPKNRITVNQVAVAVNFSLKGAAISVASESALSGNINLSNVCIYSLPESISGRDIYIAYNKELFMPRACEIFIENITNKRSKNP